LSTRLNNLSLEVRPVVKVGPLRSQPKARAPASVAWYSKTARIYVSVPGGTDAQPVTAGALASALGLTGSETNSVRVTGLKAWNISKPSDSTFFLRVAGYSALVDSNVSPIAAEDVGTATSLPGVYLNIPDSHTVPVSVAVGGSSTLCTLDVTNAGLGATTFAQKICLDLHCLVQQ